MQKIAVVILNYNGRHYLEKFLPKVIEHSINAEIIVADNASNDDSVGLLKKSFPNLNLIELEENYGFAGGYNQALKKVEAEYYVLLNSDVEVTKGWIDPVIQFLDKNKEYAGCQPKIKDFYHKDRFEYAGACGGFIDSLGYPFCRGRIINQLETDEGQYDEPIDIFWATGACLFIRSACFHEVGGFDERFFAHMEEIDLCWRLNHYKFKCIPTSVVYHIGGGTLHKQSSFKTFLNFRNSLVMLYKNLPGELTNKIIRIRLLLDYVAAMKFLIEGRPKHSIAILRAHYHFFKSKNNIYKPQPREFNPLIKSILKEYYLKKNKYFRSIIPESVVPSS